MKSMLSSILTLIMAVALLWFVWMWGFCRFYVDANEMAVVISKTGDPLPTGQILAQKEQKGIREDVLGEGRHFLNPVIYDHKIMPVILIPPGKVGMVTSKVGEELPEGEFLADHQHKGIWSGVLGPGKYRVNPYGYQVDIADAISIPIGYVGVITSQSGQQAPEGQFAGPNQKGVRRDILQPGLYYVNPKQYKVDVLEIGVNQVSLLGKAGGEVITKAQLLSQNVAMDELQNKVLQEQADKRGEYLKESSASLFRAQRAPVPAAKAMAPGEKAAVVHREPEVLLGVAQVVEFPSRDGFQISLDMTVEFELVPEDIASVFNQYGDLPAVLDKIIIPQISSITRNKGSEYGAKDFIVGEGREKFQNDLTRALATTLAQKKIVVHNALIRHVEVPAQILDPIQQASIAVEQDLTNKERQNTAKKMAQLNTELSLIEQRREQVAQETTKIKAEIKADEDKQVAEIKAEALKQVSDIERQTATARADRVRKLGVADASAVKMVEGEKANGLQLKAKAFGDPVAYTMWQFAEKLNPDVDIRILHAGEGTLWTDLEKAGMGEAGGAVIIQEKQKK